MASFLTTLGLRLLAVEDIISDHLCAPLARRSGALPFQAADFLFTGALAFILVGAGYTQDLVVAAIILVLAAPLYVWLILLNRVVALKVQKTGRNPLRRIARAERSKTTLYGLLLVVAWMAFLPGDPCATMLVSSIVGLTWLGFMFQSYVPRRMRRDDAPEIDPWAS